MWWKREAPAVAPPEQPSVFECVRHPSSCTGPNAIRADQLPFLYLWPLFLAAGCLVAAILWNMYAVPAPAPKAKLLFQSRHMHHAKTIQHMKQGLHARHHFFHTSPSRP